MARKSTDNARQMDDEVIKCFIHPATGKEMTTQAERREVAEQWCAGNYEYHHEVARKHGLLPVALLVAALIDINHPLLSSGRGTCYNSLECSIIITETMFHRQTVAQPVQADSFHRLPVERTP